MTLPNDNVGCFVCRKHRDRGNLMPGGPVVEPSWPAPGLTDLTAEEARSVGWWSTVASRALREVAGALVRDLHAHITVAGQRSSVRPSKST